MSSPDPIELIAPDDWHLHLRDEAAMADAVVHTARQFRRALVMPNLRPPVTTVDAAEHYRERICGALDERAAGLAFDPYMALYLTAETTVEEVARVAATPHVLAFKLYPAGATTNSNAGIRDLQRADPVFAAMAELGVTLCVHAESIEIDCDVFDREARFLDHQLAPLLERHPDLRVVVEHLTTCEGVEFVRRGGPQIAGTITPQHLLLNRNALFAGGLRPHHYCLPVLKRERHRVALLEAATSQHPRFFLGSDSAPHPREGKESACGCAGIFSAMTAVELYAEAFASVDALGSLEGFASRFGAEYYQLPINRERVRLRPEPREIPAQLAFGSSCVVPFRAGEHVAWTCEAL